MCGLLSGTKRLMRWVRLSRVSLRCAASVNLYEECDVRVSGVSVTFFSPSPSRNSSCLS